LYLTGHAVTTIYTTVPGMGHNDGETTTQDGQVKRWLQV